MAGTTAERRDAVEAVTAFHRSATEIRVQLDWLRRYLHGLDVDRLGMSPARFQALMIGYDIYVRMLEDVLADLADALQDRPRSDDEPADAWR